MRIIIFNFINFFLLYNEALEIEKEIISKKTIIRQKNLNLFQNYGNIDFIIIYLESIKIKY